VRLVACLLLLAALAGPAWGGPEERPQYWPCQNLARGAASSRRLHLPGRGLFVLAFRDEASFRTFWARAHEFRDTFAAPLPPPKPPRIDFTRRMVVAVVGRAASADIRLQKMWTLPGDRLVAGVFNPFWPDVAMDPERVPYQMVLTARTDRAVLPFERPAARAVSLLCQRAAEPVALGEDPVRALTDARVEQIRGLLAQHGQRLLDAFARLPSSRQDEPDRPYRSLLQGSILLRFLDRPEDARQRFHEVVVMWPGTPLADVAAARIRCIERRPEDEAARDVLDTGRATLAAATAVDEGYARRWADIAQQYTYLTSEAPLSLYLAARCYAEAARDPADADTVQNALLEAGSLYEEALDPAVAARLYWQCVLRYPDAASVPAVLDRMALIAWELDRKANVYKAFLKRFPKSRNAPAARKRLVSP
jgi:hypothetical protein